MKKRILSFFLCFVMTTGLLPTVFATESEKTPDSGSAIYVDAVNGNDDNENVGQSWETAYGTLNEAMYAAKDGDTIYLGEGTYNGNSTDPTVKGNGAGKSLTFVGAGAEKTIWQIRAPETSYGSDGYCDYSFDGSDSITFKNMTVVGSV